MYSEKKELLEIYSLYIIVFVIITFSNAISISLIKGGIALIVGILWMIATIALYFIIRKKDNKVIMVYSAINGIFAGITISAYYSLKNVQSFSVLLFTGVFVVFMAIHYILFNIIKRKDLFVRYNMLIAIIAVICSIYIIMEEKASIGSGVLFFAIIYLCFNVALRRTIKKGIKLIHTLSYASLLMFGGILLAAIALITDGDVLDVMEGSWLDDSKNKKS